MKGIAHIHTKEGSYDGQVTLDELKDFLEKEGLDFAFLSEHITGLFEKKYTKIVAKCKKMFKHSKKTIIPGIEYEIDHDRHILCLGLLNYKASVDSFLRKKDENVLLVLTHPHLDRLDDRLCRLTDMVEVWNIKHDGRYFNFHLVEFLRKKGFSSRYFIGIDAHRVRNLIPFGFKVHNEAHFDSYEDCISHIIRLMKKGRYTLFDGKKNIRIDLGPLSYANYLIFSKMYLISLKLTRKIYPSLPQSLKRFIKKIRHGGALRV